MTLGEGATPLIRSRSIGPSLGLANLYFKVESANPTGSYKDRFAAAAISRMLAAGQSKCLATSSGNTGSALAAYCAAAQLTCRIAIVETTPDGKLNQMLAYGAELARIRGFGLDSSTTNQAMQCLQDQANALDAALQISAFRYSPVGMSGVQTISYELAEQLTAGIDHVFSPAGGGGLTLAVARGFALLVERGSLARSPAVHCVQPAGNDTIAGSLRSGKNRAQAVECTSAISGLQVPNVLDGDVVIPACRASNGTGHIVSDDEIWNIQARLAREEGIFCEPAAATALAGACRAAQGGSLPSQATTVCLVTGSGFKDVASMARMTVRRDCPTIGVADLPQWLSR
ncbi:MAG: pyridoxal-phosphate dependent enzyme [Pirellulales bacterium]|nr:pyridoxal-phosphate dependent enzyme [Pirellulales bacterium]